MTAAAKSVLIFGCYLILVGLLMIAAPNALLGPLGFPVTTEVWSRVVGVLAVVLGYYYLSAARAGLTAFFRFTVPARVGVFVLFTALVLLHLAPGPLALFGAGDLAAAIWTALALRR